MDTAASDKNYTEENAQQAITYAEKMLKDALFSLLMLKDCQHGPNAALKAELSNRARISAYVIAC